VFCFFFYFWCVFLSLVWGGVLCVVVLCSSVGMIVCLFFVLGLGGVCSLFFFSFFIFFGCGFFFFFCFFFFYSFFFFLFFFSLLLFSSFCGFSACRHFLVKGELPPLRTLCYLSCREALLVPADLP